MSTAVLQPPSAKSQARVAAAVDEIIAALGLKPGARKELLAYVEDMTRPFPKLPLVSFYPAALPGGGVNHRITYRVPGYPKRTERLGKMPKPAYRRAERVSEILQQVKARLMKVEDAYRLLYVDSTPIDTHVQAFKAMLKAKGVDPDYLASTITRLQRCIELAPFTRLSDIKLAVLPDLTEKLKAYVEPGKKKKLTASTINDYLSTLRRFTRWAKRDGKIGEDPLQYSTGIKNVDKKKRRNIVIAEMGEIVATTREALGRRSNMPGADRAMLYLTAYGTGLRRKELRSLEVSWLKLSVSPSRIVVPANKTKDGKDAQQPLPEWLAVELRAWLGNRTAGKVWPKMPRHVMPMFDADRQAARLAWIEAAPTPKEKKAREESDFLNRQTVDGEMVFHSHRHAYSTNALANLDLKSAQTLTRHATASILTEIYGHSRIDQASENVEKAIKNPIKALAQSAAHLDS